MTELVMNTKKSERFKMAPLSEFYEDLLRADAFLARNTLPNHAKSLLQAFLTQKEPKIRERIAYLAKKRNISVDEMWDLIQSGNAEQTSKQELTELPEDEAKEDGKEAD
jgi:hypothetical protein